LNENENGKTVNRDKYQPLKPKGFTLEDLEFGPYIQDRYSHSIQPMEEDDKNDDNLEYPGFIDNVDGGGEVAAGLLHEKRCENMCPHKQDHGYTGYPVEYPGPHRTTTPVFETRKEPDPALESHLLPPQLLLKFNIIRVMVLLHSCVSSEK
jgi:hypothetical protein